MAKARQIVKRRKAVTNIRKITRTMQLIANSQFQAAFKRAMATKPYTEKITELADDLSATAGDVTHPLLTENPDAPRDAMFVLTSNRGLCGGYNGVILRAAMAHLHSHTDRPTDLHVVGKKGVTYFKFLGKPMAERITDINDKPQFARIEKLANQMMDRYEKKELRAVYVAYMKFISAGRQVAEVIKLLPLEKSPGSKPAPGAAPAQTVQYEFSPEPKELLAHLLPQTVRVRLFQCFTDAAVSEQIARMVAMKSATEAAEDMIKSLTRQFNRARQTQITLELLDIVGGAESLK